MNAAPTTAGVAPRVLSWNVSESPAPYVAAAPTIPARVAERLVRIERATGTFSEDGAVADLCLDALEGRARSLRDRAERWGWTKKRVEIHLAELLEAAGVDPAAVCPPSKRGGQSGDNPGTITCDNGSDTQVQGTIRGQSGDNPSPSPSPPTPPPTPPPPAHTQARAREERAPGGFPPTEAEVLEFAAMHGVLPLLAEKFFHHYEAVGWVSGGAPIRKWQSKLTGWKLSEHERPANGRNGAPSRSGDVPDLEAP